MELSSPVAGLTVASLARLAEARTAAASFRAHHPDWSFVTVIPDHTRLVRAVTAGPLTDPLLLEVDATSIGLDGRTTHRRLFEWDEHGVQRLVVHEATAALFGAHPALRHIVVLSPWAWIHGPLGDVVDAVTPDVPWAVLPRRLRPMEDATDRLSGSVHEGSEIDLFVDGAHTSDVMILHRDSDVVTDWLVSRIDRSAIDDLTSEASVDDGRRLDRWLDVAVTLFPTVTLRHPGVGVAAWNLDERPLRRVGERLMTGEHPLLVSIHSGFDTVRPWLLRPDQVRRATGRFSDDDVARRVWAAWSEEVDTQAAGLTLPARPEGDRIAAGVETSVATRRTLRLRRAALPAGADPGDPFSDPSAGPIDRIAWLRADAEAHRRQLGHGELHLIAEVDEQVLRARTEDSDAVPRTSRFPDRGARVGVDVVGHLRSSIGLGVAARSIVATLRSAGVPTSASHLPVSPAVDVVDFPVDDALEHRVLLAIMNGNVAERTRWQVGPRAYDRRYTIGQWAWETEELPLDHRRGFSYVDEVWANSTYVRDVIRECAPDGLPVEYVPIAVERPDVDPLFTRDMLGLDDRTTFLFMFDYRSVALRKNPVGLIEAYRAAFSEQDGAVLVLKSIHAAEDPDGVEEVRAAAGQRSDIRMLDGFLPRATNMALMASCDAYVSLHRSEGLGFTMAEAMLLERPVIATAYGGNMDFMDGSSAMLVPAVRVRSQVSAPPFVAGSLWSEPDLDVAGAAMRTLAESPQERRRLGTAGRTMVEDRLSSARSSGAMLDRLARCGGVA